MALLPLIHVAPFGEVGWGYKKHHGFPSGGGGAKEDTMGLFQGVVGL